jgi:hypothetical protein
MTLVRRLALAVALIAAALTAPTAHAAAPAPRMHFDNQLVVRTACFSVVNPHGTKSLLYGQHFSDGHVALNTPVIVLVHGVSSSTEDWDFSRTWSVARGGASGGYVGVS